MLEWTDDLEAFILKGYGKSLNYQMGVPLLEDIVKSMEDAIQAKERKFYIGLVYVLIGCDGVALCLFSCNNEE